MADDPTNPDGRINTEPRGHLLLIGIDRPHKYNGFTPKMGQELGDAYTVLERDDDLRCGVLHAVGPHTTAGLDMPAMGRTGPRASRSMAKGTSTVLV
jgi:enoyl-CoA hydratase/carnithine racemase